MLYADGWEAVDAIGSFGALVVAVGTSVVTSIGWWKSRGERDRLLTRDRRREREAQARQVVIGREDFTITTDDEVDPETGAPSHVEWRTRAIVFNGSSAPIAGMAVYVVFRDRDPSYVDGTDYFRPGREDAVAIPERLWPRDNELVVRFRDAAGRHWERHESGRLTRTNSWGVALPDAPS